MPQSWHKYFQWWLMDVISHILTLNYSERHGRMERIFLLNVLYLMLWLIHPLLRMWKVYPGWTFLIFRLFDHFCRIMIKVFSSFHKKFYRFIPLSCFWTKFCVLTLSEYIPFYYVLLWQGFHVVAFKVCSGRQS